MNFKFRGNKRGIAEKTGDGAAVRRDAKLQNGVMAMSITALAAAIISVISPWSIPVGPIPVTLCSFAIYLISSVLGGVRGAAAVGIYILLGGVGLPVFSGFAGGLQVVAGATGGYIIGYIPCALITGGITSLSRKWYWSFAGMLLGTAVLYAVGTAWYMLLSDVKLVPALSACVLPFLPFDIVKMAVASYLGRRLRTAMERRL